MLRGDLDVYRDICELACIGEYPKDCRQYEFDCCMDFVEGLLYAIELGFPRGYNQIALHVGLNEHMAGGGGRDADMSSYESFSRDFYKEMKFHLSDAFEDDTTDYENIMEEMFPDKFDITDDLDIFSFIEGNVGIELLLNPCSLLYQKNDYRSQLKDFIECT